MKKFPQNILTSHKINHKGHIRILINRTTVIQIRMPTILIGIYSNFKIFSFKIGHFTQAMSGMNGIIRKFSGVNMLIIDEY